MGLLWGPLGQTSLGGCSQGRLERGPPDQGGLDWAQTPEALGDPSAWVQFWRHGGSGCKIRRVVQLLELAGNGLGCSGCTGQGCQKDRGRLFSFQEDVWKWLGRHRITRGRWPGVGLRGRGKSHEDAANCRTGLREEEAVGDPRRGLWPKWPLPSGLRMWARPACC